MHCFILSFVVIMFWNEIWSDNMITVSSVTATGNIFVNHVKALEQLSWKMLFKLQIPVCFGSSGYYTYMLLFSVFFYCAKASFLKHLLIGFIFLNRMVIIGFIFLGHCL